MTLANFARRCIDDLFPRSCAICGDGLRDRNVCAPCRADLPWIEAACPGCGLPRDTNTPPNLPCADCQRRPLPLHAVVAPLHYRFPVDAMIKSLKFRHHTWIAPALAELLAAPVERAGIAADAIVPVPLHRWRHARRGFNQAREIADELGKRIRLPVRPILRRTRATKAQSDLAADERRHNVHGAFRVRGTTVRNVLLLDDVITTGETIRAAALALKKAGTERVYAIAVARASWMQGRKRLEYLLPPPQRGTGTAGDSPQVAFAPHSGDPFGQIKRSVAPAQRTEPFLKTVTGVRRGCQQR